MRTRRGVQHWLERKAQTWAFIMAAIGMIARATSAYSGGTLQLDRLLGPVGMNWYTGLTSASLAVGAELLASIAGRASRRHRSEAEEIAARPGLRRWERQALIARFTRQAREAFAFSMIGLGASVYGAMSFLWSANAHHDALTIAGELVVTTLLVCIVYYFGVIHQEIADDPAQVAEEKASGMRLRQLDQAGARIASGQHTPQDVAIFAESLPRAERARFRAIMAQDGFDDPLWSAAQVAEWLGGEQQAVRRRVSRKLRDAEARGLDIRRDERGAYQLLRSQVFRLFAADFAEMHSRRDMAGTRTSQPVPAAPALTPVPRDMDRTPVDAGQAVGA